MLMSENGGFRIAFSSSPDFKSPDTHNYLLEKRGDFIAWGANLYHQAFVERESTTLTIRWEPTQGLSH
ncbi:signal peptidase i [Leptolyngbya sp. Heron Island J]|nr:signal peptidase i [Leptolyngbya sp. Heron Island J]